MYVSPCPTVSSSHSMPSGQSATRNVPTAIAILSPAEYLRIDSERLRCVKCGRDFIPSSKGGPPCGRIRKGRNAGEGVCLKSAPVPAFPLDSLELIGNIAPRRNRALPVSVLLRNRNRRKKLKGYGDLCYYPQPQALKP